MKNDFEFIKEIFDNDNLSAPNSISENEILNMLGDKPKMELYQRKGFKAFISAAACFALVVGIISYALPNGKQQSFMPENQVLVSFNSYSEIKKEINKYEHNVSKGIYYLETDSATDVAENNATSDGVSTTVSADFKSETYVQVEGVDEADIIKNDGKYIYYLNDSYEIMIYEDEKLVSKIIDHSIEKWDEIYDVDGTSFEAITDFYIRDDRLILCGSSDKYENNKYTSLTNIYIYDISDIVNPKFVEKFSQSGYYSSSRMIGDELYLISAEYKDYCKTVEDCYITTCVGEEKTTLPASSIYKCDEVVESNYIVISAIDTLNLKRTAQPKAFFGCGSDIYCNLNNLYLTLRNDNNTKIIKAELNSDEINFTATGEVNGTIHNQFSMDERNGYFRIATSDDNGNNLYVLDENLKKLGEVTGFAKDETIQAVKYIGDMAYVITYEFTDPLFVIDLTVPSEPVIKGSVEITGFSSQLIPVDENTILGVGYDETDGMKFALFDISNPCVPTVLDSYILPSTSSEAQYNHKAIVVNREKNYFAFDFIHWDNSKEISGALIVKTDNNKINIADKYIIDKKDASYSYASRVCYIDDIIYILDNNGNIYSFNN